MDGKLATQKLEAHSTRLSSVTRNHGSNSLKECDADMSTQQAHHRLRSADCANNKYAMVQVRLNKKKSLDATAGASQPRKYMRVFRRG